LNKNIKELAHWFFSPYTNLGIAEGDSGFEDDERRLDLLVVGA